MQSEINKKIVLIIIAMSGILFINISAVYANDYDYIDYSDRHTYANETLGSLVEVYAYDEHYDFDEAQQMIDRIGEIPEIILRHVLEQEVRLIFVDFPITDLYEFSHLRGKQPRGHDPGAVWDDVPGGGGEITVVRIGHSEPGLSHGSLNLEYHEFGHAIEYALFNSEIYRDPDFTTMHAREKSNLFPYDDYMDFSDEYFAETLSYYYLDESDKAYLKEYAPETYAFIEDLSTYVLLVEENTTENITLSWDTREDAAYYEILRDGKIIDTVQEGKYVDTTFSSNTSHEYQIIAYYIDGTVRHETMVIEEQTHNNEVITLRDTDTLHIDEVGTSHVYFGWTPIKNADRYEVYRDGEKIATTHITQLDDRELEGETTYFYEVRAYNVNDTSITLPTLSITTDDIPKVNNQMMLIVISIIVGIIIVIILLISLNVWLARKRKQQIKYDD